MLQSKIFRKVRKSRINIVFNYCLLVPIFIFIISIISMIIKENITNVKKQESLKMFFFLCIFLSFVSFFIFIAIFLLSIFKILIISLIILIFSIILYFVDYQNVIKNFYNSLFRKIMNYIFIICYLVNILILVILLFFNNLKIKFIFSIVIASISLIGLIAFFAIFLKPEQQIN